MAGGSATAFRCSRSVKELDPSAKFHQRVHLHFFQHVSSMKIDRLFANVQFSGDGFGVSVGDEQLQDFLFALTEFCDPGFDGGKFKILLSYARILRQCLLDWLNS